MKAYLTSVKGSTASMTAYNVSLQGSVTGFSKVSTAIQQYNALGSISKKEQQEFATAVGLTNNKLGTYLTGLNGSNASLRGYGVSLVASTAKTIGLTVATVALNAALTWGISAIVTGLITAFTSWINKSEEITEKAQEAADKINSITDTLKTNTETVENAKKRYAELAQEVENLGKITQSQGTLDNEEYEEFLDLSNQLAGVFPSLTKNYDENGNAILDLSGDVNTIVSSLDDLIQKEKELANQQIMEKFPDVFKGYAQDVSEAESKVKSAQTEFDKINNAYQQLSNGSTAQAFDLQGNGWFTNEDGEKVTLLMGEYCANLEALGLEYTKTQLKVKNQFGGDTITGYLIEATGDIDEAFASKLETARNNLQYAQQQLEGEKSSINSYLNTWLQGEFSYVQIEDSGLQAAIQEMLFNFDFSNIPENKRGDWNYVSEYLRRNILFEINKVQDDPVISKAISEVFSNTELTPDEKANYLQQIQDYFGEDSSIVISLKPQIDETTTLQKQYDKAIEDTKAKFDGYDPTAFFKKHSINTKEEIDTWLEIAQAANSAAEAEKRYVQGSTFDNETEIQWKNLDNLESKVNSIQSAYNTVTSAITEYNKQGYLNMDTIDSLISLDDEYINKLVDENGQLQYNAETFKELARIKLEEAKASVYQEFCTELARIKTLDAEVAANELALANGTLTESAYETAKALYEEYIAMKDVDFAHKDLAINAWESTEKKIALLDNQLDNVISSTYNFEKASKSSSKSTQKEYKEVFDFFERRIDILNNSLDLLKSNLENVNGSFAKNQLIDAQSSIYQEEIKNYTDALNMYQQKANEVLATLPDDIAEKIKNGSISLTTFMGESSEAVVDAMKDYEGWSDKIADCSQKLAELKETLRDLELEKFNNIIEDFTNQFDLRQTGINNIDKQIALFEESGMLIGKSFYQAQREQASKQLDILKEQQKTMANQLSSALSSGNIEAGTDEWIEMVSELQNVEGSILDCKKAIEEFDNAILDLHWQVFERIQDQFSNLDSELDNLIGLLDDIDVADTSGNWTTDSITKLGLLTQQYELAQYNVAEYNKAIEELKEQYANGEYSAIEYADKLAELSDGMWENANAVEAVKDAIMDLHEARVDKEIEGIEEEIEAYNELIQAKIDELDAEKELNDYRNSISQKSKSITDLERQIAAMSNDTTAATVAQRKKLEEQLAEAKKELEDAEYDHSIQSQKDALNKQYEDYEKTRNDEIEALRDSLNNQEKLIADSFETVKQNASTIGQQISNIAKQHGVQVSNSLTSSWQAGENAIASYGSVLSSKSSAFISNIMGVENEVWALQNQADNTAVSLAYMFSTQADNLVNELAESYYAEGNLLNMTNALQSSLVNALERGYDISGITTALKGIENAANSAGAAIDLFNSKSLSDKSDNRWKVVDSKGNTLSETSLSYNEAADWLKNYEKKNPKKKGSLDIMHYAKGTRNSKGNLIVKDEQGYELVLPKLASGKYAIENEGSQILTKVETDNIFDWAKFNPDMFIPQFANNFATPISHIASKNVNNVAPSVNVGNLITVQGNVDSSNIKQMEIIANKAVNNLVDKMYNGKKYGSY